METEFEYTPDLTIDRLCAHHQTDPKRLLVALLKALARWRLHGWKAFPDVKPLPGPDGKLPPPNIHAELQTLMREQQPPLDPEKVSVGSIFDAVIMCVNYDQWLHERSIDEMDEADRGEREMSDSEYMQCIFEGNHAHDESVLLLVMKECCNQLEAMKLEMSLKD